jgi:hypothetical protein
VAVAGAVHEESVQVKRPGALMVIVQTMEILLNEVSPQLTPFPLDQIRTLRFDFTVPVQQRDGRSLQSRNGACGGR